MRFHVTPLAPEVIVTDTRVGEKTKVDGDWHFNWGSEGIGVFGCGLFVMSVVIKRTGATVGVIWFLRCETR